MSGGGVPVRAAGAIVGGIGISGAPTGEEDDRCCDELRLVQLGRNQIVQLHRGEVDVLHEEAGRQLHVTGDESAARSQVQRLRIDFDRSLDLPERNAAHVEEGELPVRPLVTDDGEPAAAGIECDHAGVGIDLDRFEHLHGDDDRHLHDRRTHRGADVQLDDENLVTALLQQIEQGSVRGDRRALCVLSAAVGGHDRAA